MRANDIEVLTIPLHTSHILQPLDSIPFAQFKKHWEKNLMCYNSSHSGQALKKVDFWEVFTPAWNAAMCVKILWQGLGTQVFTRITHWLYPPRHWPQVKSLTMVRYFGVSVGVGFLISSSRSIGVSYWIILTGTACLCFCKEKKHIHFKKLFRLITRNISPLWEGRTVGFHLQRLAFTKSCCLNKKTTQVNSKVNTCQNELNQPQILPQF